MWVICDCRVHGFLFDEDRFHRTDRLMDRMWGRVLDQVRDRMLDRFRAWDWIVWVDVLVDVWVWDP